jgi:fused signal recognition particle receptor
MLDQLSYGEIAAFSSMGFIGVYSVLNIIFALKTKSKQEPTTKKQTQTSTLKSVDQAATSAAPEKVAVNWNDRLNKGLESSRKNIWHKIANLVTGKKLDNEIIEEVEEILFSADISPMIVDRLLEDMKTEFDSGQGEFKDWIKNYFKNILNPVQEKSDLDFWKGKHQGLKVVMIVGVNGAGKTTTIGKLATHLSNSGSKVVVAACDTFRAAAVEQLEVWSQRAGCEIVKGVDGGDPSGVAYDAVAKAKKMGADYCLIDTAGRLHTAGNLMDELSKTKRVIQKIDQNAPHATLLVLDAVTGQNAIKQAEEFNKALELSGLIFTKCDGSSKAGSAVSIVDQLKVPISWIGVGEQVEDLNEFAVDDYLNALIS